MCGGVRFPYDAALEPELQTIYTPDQLGTAQQTGLLTALFWQPIPVLPVQLDGQVRLVGWGNRANHVRLPPTGWVRLESLTAGKWDYLRPREVIISAVQGLERRVWFTIDHGLKGYLVEREGEQRVYMLTVPPTQAYQTLTGHDRMPVLIDQTTVVPLVEPTTQQRTLGI